MRQAELDGVTRPAHESMERHQSGVARNWSEIARLVSSASDTTIDRIRIDPSVVRGLEYYTGPVFEVELTFETTDEDGHPVRFGSVGGGGRYDGLVSRFRGEPVPATGFSIGVSRLLAALTHLGKIETQARARPGGRHRVRQATASPTTSAWSRAAQRRHPRRALSRLRQIGPQMKYADRAALPASSSRAPTRRPRARCRSRT